MVHIHNGLLLSHKKDTLTPFAATWMQLEILILNKPERKRQTPYDITYLWNLKYGTDDPIYKTETNHSSEEQTCDSQGRGERVGWMGSSRFWDANCYIWNGWAVGPYSIAQGTKTVCDWVTLLYNRN